MSCQVMVASSLYLRKKRRHTTHTHFCTELVPAGSKTERHCITCSLLYYSTPTRHQHTPWWWWCATVSGVSSHNTLGEKFDTTGGKSFIFSAQSKKKKNRERCDRSHTHTHRQGRSNRERSIVIIQQATTTTTRRD